MKCLNYFFFLLLLRKAAIMDRVSSDKAKNLEIPIWKTYQEILANEKPDIELELVCFLLTVCGL
jgi:hypothetical protein